MTKKEALLKLKVAFRNPNIATHRLKEIRDMYSSVKELPISENATIAKPLEAKVNSI